MKVERRNINAQIQKEEHTSIMADSKTQAADKAAENNVSKAKAPKEKKRGIGTVAMEAIRAGKTNQQALEQVMKEFPEGNTSLASINWYRNKLRSDGENVPTSRDLAKAAKGDEKPAAKPAAKPTAAKTAPAKDPLE